MRRKRTMLAVFSSLLVTLFCAAAERKYNVPFTSMEPTIPKGSGIVADLNAYSEKDPQRWDIVIFRPPPSAGGGTIWLFRIVGLPGEKIDITSAGVILVNGEPIERPSRLAGLRWQRRPNLEVVTAVHPVVLPADGYYVLGDNTQIANDSRLWGFLPKSNILGKVISSE